MFDVPQKICHGNKAASEMPVESPRVYGLDVLRAVAIMLVLLTHGIYFFTDSWDMFHLIKYIPDGVSIFFVLSGFLIGNILIKTMNRKGLEFGDLKNFWIRRWFRTLPAYYFVLCLLAGSSWLIGSTGRPMWEYVKYFFFLHAFQNGNCILYLESWSLCVEEFFYLIIPALLFFLIKLTNVKIKKVLAFSILFVIVSGTLFTLFKINTHDYTTNEDWDIFIRKTVFTRLSSIMYGFLGAYLMFYYYHLWKYKTALLFAGLALFILLGIRPAFGIGPFLNYEQLSLESIATLLLIPKLSALKRGKGVVFKVLTFISTISYSVYLINFTPFYIVITKMDSFINFHAADHAFFRLTLFLTWSVGVGYLMHRFVEKPMMRKRESFSQREYYPTVPTYLK